MKTAIFLSDREQELLVLLLERELNSFGNENNLLFIEYRDILEQLKKRGIDL